MSAENKDLNFTGKLNIIEATSKMLARLPGLGPRSARRLILHLLENRETTMTAVLEALEDIKQRIQQCETCYNLDITNPCNICSHTGRDSSKLCVVEQVSDLWALERGHVFNGTYHVLGGVLSAMDGITPEDLRLHKLLERTEKGDLQEIILATNLTVEGQTTAHYICDMLKALPVKITRLAHGIPAGGELDYLDDGTLSAALKARQNF